MSAVLATNSAVGSAVASPQPSLPEGMPPPEPVSLPVLVPFPVVVPFPIVVPFPVVVPFADVESPPDPCDDEPPQAERIGTRTEARRTQVRWLMVAMIHRSGRYPETAAPACGSISHPAIRAVSGGPTAADLHSRAGQTPYLGARMHLEI